MRFLNRDFSKVFNDKLMETLSDDTISISELDDLTIVQETFDKLTTFDQKSIKEWLKKENLTIEDLLKERDLKQKQLKELSFRLDFPLENPFEVCVKLSQQEKYSKEIGEFLRLFVPAHGLFLHIDTTDDKYEQITEYGLCFDELIEVDNILSTIESLQENWNRLKPLLLTKTKSELLPTNVTKEELLKVYCINLAKPKNTEIFLYNLESLLTELNQAEHLRKLAPLYLFQMFVRHKSRLEKNKDLTVKMTSLWTYKEYAITENNGKNFQKAVEHNNLFMDLCLLFKKDSSVNDALSKWGFFQCSNLLEFNRDCMQGQADAIFPLFDDLVKASLFSCYRCGGYDAFLLKECDLTFEKITFFQCLPNYHPLLQKIEDYINDHAFDLCTRFIACESEDIYGLCLEIMDNSGISMKENKLNQRKTNLFLCSINISLQELKDNYAKEYLILGLMKMFRG